MENVQIITDTLEAQAANAEKHAEQARNEVAQHQGARDVLQVAARALAPIIDKAEAEIEADSELSSNAKAHALKHVGQAMRRATVTLTEIAKNQANQVWIAQGKASMAESLATAMRKTAQNEQAKTSRRRELEAEEAAGAEAERVMGEITKPKRKRKTATKTTRKRAKKSPPNGENKAN